MSKKIVVEKDDEQPYDSMSDPEIETDEKSSDIVANKKKPTHPKKIALTRNDVKEKIAKCKINRQRLDLRQLQINSRSLAVQSRIEANKADISKLNNLLETTTGPA